MPAPGSWETSRITEREDKRSVNSPSVPFVRTDVTAETWAPQPFSSDSPGRAQRFGVRQHAGESPTPVELHVADVEEGPREDQPTRPSLHDLRHTSVALAIANGAHPKAIQERMGHSSITITFDRYGHLFPSLGIAVADGLEATYHAALTGDADKVATVTNLDEARRGDDAKSQQIRVTSGKAR